MRVILAILFALALFHHRGAALQVTPGSSCADVCLDNPESNPNSANSSNTTPDDITCVDQLYDTSTTGIKFKNCVDCLQKSNATSGNESDTAWFLCKKIWQLYPPTAANSAPDNLRYSVDVCLFGFPNASAASEISSPCDIDFACAPLKTALEAGNLSANGAEYGYCWADDYSFSGAQLQSCQQCFASSSSQVYLANFITALQAGCEQQPKPGSLLGLSDTLFTNSLVSITEPPVQESPSSNKGGGGFTTGDIVGVVLGAILLFLGGLGLFGAYRRRQRHLARDNPTSDYNHRTRDNSTGISRPMHATVPSTDSKTMMWASDYELRSQQQHPKNADHYNMLEKEMQMRQPTYAFNPNMPGLGLGAPLPTHPAYRPQTHSRQASADSVARQPVPARAKRPDSYALQAYLNASEHPGMPLPPPGPPPAASLYGPQSYMGPSPGHSRTSSLADRGPSPDRRPLLNPEARQPQRPEPQASQTPFTLPPPPPRAPKVPALTLPSIPRIRVPKKYNPPQITVEGPTPVEGTPWPPELR
ncbi:hypothetical protein GGR56DRAFT_90914 [Xylariaceae sp. FL0804]|nr:hypothetical protein GGR56DRAFT_90914 [Xylariaceae sp. FL0804]